MSFPSLLEFLFCCLLSMYMSPLCVPSRGVTIHQWHGSVRFTVLEPRFGSVRFGVGVGFMSSYQQY